MPYGKDKVVQACHGAHSLSTERLALLLLLFSKYEHIGKNIGQNSQIEISLGTVVLRHLFIIRAVTTVLH